MNAFGRGTEHDVVSAVPGALSAAGASGYAGAPWFAGLIEQGRAEYPDVQLTAILDCADRAGDVMVAFALGLKTIVFNGHPDAAERLKQIGATYGASIIATRPAAFDPPPWRDPSHAARTFIKNL